jgi:hypothetical protein
MASTNTQIALFALGAYALYRFKVSQDAAVAEQFSVMSASNSAPAAPAAPAESAAQAESAAPAAETSVFDLLPSAQDDLEFSQKHPVTKGMHSSMLKFNSRIGQISPVMRNTNWNIRAEPPVPHIPNLTWFNKSNQTHQNVTGLGKLQDPYA